MPINGNYRSFTNEVRRLNIKMKIESTGKREETERRLWAAFEAIREEGKPTGPSAFAKQVGIDRTYLYTFPSLAAEISAYGRRTQPTKSRRGAGIMKEAAQRRETEARVRREHQQWSHELPQLRHHLEKLEQKSLAQAAENKTLRERLARTQRAYELLLMLASEAGVSPRELEALQEKVRECSRNVNTERLC
jgi:chromosome segregation ATPase